jgi:hypothetical protein
MAARRSFSAAVLARGRPNNLAAMSLVPGSTLDHYVIDGPIRDMGQVFSRHRPDAEAARGVCRHRRAPSDRLGSIAWASRRR